MQSPPGGSQRNRALAAVTSARRAAVTGTYLVTSSLRCSSLLRYQIFTHEAEVDTGWPFQRIVTVPTIAVSSICKSKGKPKFVLPVNLLPLI